MATNKWTGNAPAIAEVDTLTPASVTIGNIFTATISNKAVTFTATANTVANVCTGLAAAINASGIAEFQEITAQDNVTDIVITAKTAGRPFTMTSSAATGAGSGGCTLTHAVATANSGPNDINVATNWSLGAVPVATNDVYFDQSNVDALYNLQVLAAVALNSLTIRASYTGRVGLPDYNGTYYEYRQKYFQFLSATITIGDGPGNGSGRIKLDPVATQTAITVWHTAAPNDPGFESVMLLGTNASNTLTIYHGVVAVAGDTSSVATYATINMGLVNGSADASLRCGSGATLTTVNQNAGTVVLNGACTTFNALAGTTVIYGSGAFTTLTIEGGDVFYESSGTITTLLVGATGTADFTKNLSARTVTNATFTAGATVLDSFKTVTWSNAFLLSHCNLNQVTIDLGTHFHLLPS